ncbi:MAG: Checkpoint kinase 2 [Trizodia sp. TS-e1964]|nr:MAG: Checkpoint kinase 2 [Trizodia sp. TS-e1964]
MASISAAASRCLLNFSLLVAALQDPERWPMMPRDKVEREYDRFKIWCGNLGVRQHDSSSLDYRLRDSAVVRTNVLKLLGKLQKILTMSSEVASGARPPFESLPKPEQSESSEEGSDEEDLDDEPQTELGLNMTSISEILSDLYAISFKIRNSSSRPVHLKPLLYKEVDEESGVDKFTTYAEFDKRYVEASIINLRKEVAQKYSCKISPEANEILGEDAF